MNNVSLMGRLVRDPELKQTSNGISRAAFTVAVDRRYAKDGQKQADFINCVSWRKTAEVLCKYFKKGDMIALTGSIQCEVYEKDGEKNYVTNVNVDGVYFVGSKRSGNISSTASESASQANPFEGDLPDDDESNLPF